jgi:hypothetical protein
MPTADLLTAIRPANDIDVVEETAWGYAAQYVPTPQLLFAAMHRAELILDPESPDWYTLKARPCD